MHLARLRALASTTASLSSPRFRYGSTTTTTTTMMTDSYVSLLPSSNHPIASQWATARTENKAGETRTFYEKDRVVVAVSAGDKLPEDENEKKELARRNAALGLLALKAAKSTKIEFDGGLSAHSTAVGATLASFVWNLKSTTEAKKKLEPVTILPASSQPKALPSESQPGLLPLNFETGLIYGRAQNLARELMELPANVCTPTIFTDRAKKELDGLSGVKVEVHDEAWAKEKKMGSFLSVAAGTDEPAKFLEATYFGAENKDDAPIAFIGKGITFDSGGISLKPGASMKDMRADMGGAATTLSAFWAIAKLRIKVNMVLCIPLTENMPSGKATKPGDIVTASNGVTIEVDNTDAEGRLVLADALVHATTAYSPHTVVDVATLTGAMMIALGNQFTGVFTNSDELWKQLDEAEASERDRVWRMPLDEGYIGQINGTGMDLCNTGGRLAGSCTAAIFLKRFVNGLIVDGKDQPEATIKWAHCDIAGVMDLAKPDAYNTAGMTGRPVRTLIEFARRSVKA